MKKCIIACLLMVMLTACSSTNKPLPSELYRNESANIIYQRGVVAVKDKSYGEAIKRFEALTVQYPDFAKIEKAQYYLTYVYYEKGEYALAVNAAEHFINEFPSSPYAPHVLFLQGVSRYYQHLGMMDRYFSTDLSFRDMKQAKLAFGDFKLLVDRYPDSIYREHAKQYMVYIRNLLAKHELDVAQYYYHKQAYAAAVDRAETVVWNYEGSPYVKPALRIAILANQKLGHSATYNDLLKLYKFNYPNDVIVDDAN